MSQSRLARFATSASVHDSERLRASAFPSLRIRTPRRAGPLPSTTSSIRIAVLSSKTIIVSAPWRSKASLAVALAQLLEAIVVDDDDVLRALERDKAGLLELGEAAADSLD